MINTVEELQVIVDRVDTVGLGYRWIVKEDGSAFYVQLHYGEVDVDDPSGALADQRGRKWRISRHMLPDEVVRTMLAACMASAEHRVREHFLVDGVRAFGPHIALDDLIAFVASHGEKKRTSEKDTLLLRVLLSDMKLKNQKQGHDVDIADMVDVVQKWLTR